MALNVDSKTKNTQSFSSFFSSGNGVRNSPLPKTGGSESAVALQTAIAKSLSDLNDQTSASVIVVEGNGLAYSTIAMCYWVKSNPELVAYHLLILESTGKEPDPLVFSEGSLQISHQRVTSDAFDEEMVKVVKERLSREFPQSKLHNVGASVVYRNQETIYKTQQGENVLTEKFRNVIYKAFNMMNTDLMLALNPGSEIDLSAIVREELDNNRRTGLVAQVRQERQNLETDTNNVIRSDVTISFRTKRYSTNNNYSLNGGQQSEEIGTINGFVDLVNTGSFNGLYANMNQQQQRYVARFVLTRLVSELSYTPGAILMILSTISTMTDNNNWATLFRTKHTNKKEIDYTDIGALGIENNLTPNIPDAGFKHIDTKSESVTPGAFAALVSSLIRPKLMISIDVMDNDIDSTYLEIFAKASAPTPVMRARKMIYDAAVRLTGGAFQTVFPDMNRMFFDSDNRIHMGYFMKGGERHDIREIDYVAVANYASATKDNAILTRWAQTFNDKNTRIYTRLAERKAIIDTITNGSFVLTGYATRVTFTGAFIDALVESISNTGMSIEADIPLNASSMTTGVTPINSIDDALASPQVTPLRSGGIMSNDRFGNVGLANNVGNRFL